MNETLKEPARKPPPPPPPERGGDVPRRVPTPGRPPASYDPDPRLGRVGAPDPPRLAPAEEPPRPGRRYAYRNPWVRRAFGALDAAGDALRRAKRPRPETVRRVLLMRPDHLGDMLFSLPAVRSLRKRLPNAHIDMLINPETRPLLQDRPVDSLGVYPLEYTCSWLLRPKEARVGLGSAWGLARFLRRRIQELGGPYDVAVDLRGDFQLILAARLAGCRYLVGRGITGLGFLLDEEGEETEGRHQVEGNFHLLERAGFGPLEAANPRIVLSEAEERAGREALATRGVPAGSLLVGIHPGAGQPTKRWGAEKYARLIERITSRLGARPVLLGGPADREVAAGVLARIGDGGIRMRVVDLCGRLGGLRGFMAVARACRLFVGNDSGPGHIAAALGVPFVGVFSGTNDPAEWGPRGPAVVVVRKRIDCEGCGLTFCDHHSCMAGLDVETVFQAVRRCVSE